MASFDHRAKSSSGGQWVGFTDTWANTPDTWLQNTAASWAHISENSASWSHVSKS